MVGLLLSAPDGPSAAATADADGATPLHCALKPNFLGGSGGLRASGSLRASTAADCVCGGDRQGVLRLLVSALAGANSAFGQAVDRAAGEQRITALMLAADAGDCDALELLLGTGQARPDVQDAAGLTALALATLRGHLHAVQLLLDAHASVDKADRNGRRPLMLAAEARKLMAAELLLSRGAHLEGLPAAVAEQLVLEVIVAKKDCEAHLAAKQGEVEAHRAAHAGAEDALAAARADAATLYRQLEVAAQERSVLQRRVQHEQERSSEAQWEAQREREAQEELHRAALGDAAQAATAAERQHKQQLAAAMRRAAAVEQASQQLRRATELLQGANRSLTAQRDAAIQTGAWRKLCCCGDSRVYDEGTGVLQAQAEARRLIAAANQALAQRSDEEQLQEMERQQQAAAAAAPAGAAAEPAAPAAEQAAAAAGGEQTRAAAPAGDTSPAASPEDRLEAALAALSRQASPLADSSAGPADGDKTASAPSLADSPGVAAKMAAAEEQQREGPAASDPSDSNIPAGYINWGGSTTGSPTAPAASGGGWATMSGIPAHRPVV
ncbi:TANC1 isoform X2 [Micractinium conductrix]|uniref:TANC1 isoform X2 n=1 Tax=Micractinium conductrix TaxID=554055 RepID=A0A2P6VJ04_9CHLO|nr:TANC1 isoform X2 [Micractinium conductrix]|eukprot:PSC74058.1 TANC1 isoform X2 [Micractinium conductrix]